MSSGPNPSRAAGAPPAARAGGTVVVGLAGHPNVGKSTVFNLLTGLDQHVGNWPGKTVERKEGTYARDGTTFRIVDLPGTYSLTSNSEEERVTRDFILGERPDVVVMIADASSLERNLYLMAELLVLPVPVVLGLNMMDVAESQGLGVEPHVLEAALGLPVVPLIASKARGVMELVAAVERVHREPGSFRPSRPEIGEPHRPVLDRVRALVSDRVPAPYTPDWVALKLLEGDVELTEKARAWLSDDLWQRLEAILHEHEDAILDIGSGRYQWIGRMMRAAVARPPLGRMSVTDRLDRFAVHPYWGLLLLVAAFSLVFSITYLVTVPVQNWLDVGVIEPAREQVRGALGGAPGWVPSLLADGVLAGAGTVVTFLPILVVFFAALGVLEDTGYLARAAFVMDRFMHRMGLHGKSFLPLFMGFGCNVPAVMGTRVIESRPGRLLTILLAPLVPCTARLAVLAFLAPAFFGRSAALVSGGLVALNVVLLALLGVALNRTVFRGERVAFIMELPLYHAPNLRTIAMFVWRNVSAFLRNAASIILVFSIAVWALAAFPGPDLQHSYLASFGRTLEPVGRLLGMDWRMIVALLGSFIAKENAVATLGVLYNTGDNAAGLAQTMAAEVSPATALSFLVVSMLFIPCAATVSVIRKETGGWRWTLASVGLLLGVALAAGACAYQAARLLGFGA